VTGQSVYWPRPVKVETASGGQPATVDSVAVDAVREEWLVEDRWWTSEPLRRHYLEVVLRNGRCVVVFQDLVSGRWYEQR
jgi:hypothetical protein